MRNTNTHDEDDDRDDSNYEHTETPSSRDALDRWARKNYDSDRE